MWAVVPFCVLNIAYPAAVRKSIRKNTDNHHALFSAKGALIQAPLSYSLIQRSEIATFYDSVRLLFNSFRILSSFSSNVSRGASALATGWWIGVRCNVSNWDRSSFWRGLKYGF